MVLLTDAIIFIPGGVLLHMLFTVHRSAAKPLTTVIRYNGGSTGIASRRVRIPVRAGNLGTLRGFSHPINVRVVRSK